QAVFPGEAYAAVVADIIQKAQQLILLNRSHYVGVVEKATGIRRAPDSDNVALKDIRWPDDIIRLHDKDRWLIKQQEKVEKSKESRQKKIDKAGTLKTEKGRKAARERAEAIEIYKIPPLPADTGQDMYKSRGDLLAYVQAELERLDYIRAAAQAGTFYLPGGVIQPPVVYAGWQKLAAPEMISVESAKSLSFQSTDQPITSLE
ncbi:unnamed protein product, partial [marine sediment metagenome]